MKSSLLVALIALGSALPLFAADAPPSDVVLFDHAKVDAAFAKGVPLLTNSQYKVLAGRRDRPGEVEIHTRDTDVFYVVEGSATIVTGGQAVDPRQTGDGEFKAKSSTGGTAHKLTKGDVLVIPAGVPHWINEVEPPFLYFVVKSTK